MPDHLHGASFATKPLEEIYLGSIVSVGGSFIETIAAAGEAYRSNPASFGPGSDNAKKIVKLVGGSDAYVAGVLALYGFPTLAEQASSTWLGGDAKGGRCLWCARHG